MAKAAVPTLHVQKSCVELLYRLHHEYIMRQDFSFIRNEAPPKGKKHAGNSDTITYNVDFKGLISDLM